MSGCRPFCVRATFTLHSGNMLLCCLQQRFPRTIGSVSLPLFYPSSEVKRPEAPDAMTQNAQELDTTADAAVQDVLWGGFMLSQGRNPTVQDTISLGSGACGGY